MWIPLLIPPDRFLIEIEAGGCGVLSEEEEVGGSLRGGGKGLMFWGRGEMPASKTNPGKEPLPTL